MHVLSPSIRTRVTLLPASTERDGSLGFCYSIHEQTALVESLCSIT
uniref:Uncharacterized protein n=1 Tax=Picea glauca TaxID=3330 RepID=A0A124GN33_PICGL|nr:hypothetical protein ABT39_MTgene5758 [Picea glauca]